MRIDFTIPNEIVNYKKQFEFINCKSRFVIVEATTKAGKTVGCIVWLFMQALHGRPGSNYWWVAPIYSQSKIAFERMCRFISPRNFFTANKSEQSITLVNGAKIYFKTGTNADSLYGEDVRACVIDEATRVGESSWHAIFSTLTATNGKCRIIGNVKGTKNWAYRLAREAEAGKQDWKFFKITADDAVSAGVMSNEVLEEARRTLPPGVFNELYYGIPFVTQSNKFTYMFDAEKHIGDVAHDNTRITYLSFDFNVNPITCIVVQWDGGKKVNVVEVIQLSNSNIFELSKYIKSKYQNCTFKVTGDASGQNTSTLSQNNLNNFDIIKQVLGLTRWSLDLFPANQRLVDSQTLVNAVLGSCDVVIDRNNAQPLIFDLQNAVVDEQGKLKKANRTKEEEKLDALDALRYWFYCYLHDRFSKLIS